MPTSYYSNKIIVIIYENISKNIPRLRSAKFLLSLSASASAFAPSAPIELPTKIIRIWKNNRLFIAIINKNRNFV